MQTVETKNEILQRWKSLNTRAIKREKYIAVKNFALRENM